LLRFCALRRLCDILKKITEMDSAKVRETVSTDAEKWRSMHQITMAENGA